MDLINSSPIYPPLSHAPLIRRKLLQRQAPAFNKSHCKVTALNQSGASLLRGRSADGAGGDSNHPHGESLILTTGLNSDCSVHDSTKQESPLTDRLFSHTTNLLTNVVNSARKQLIQVIVDLLFKRSSENNISFQGNFAPVAEIGNRGSLKLVEGEVPKDFPMGVYIRNGPNPRFGADHLTSPFGKVLFHWFEGDGMLHATYFGPNGDVTYENKFIETEGYLLEKQSSRRLWLNTIEGDPKAVSMGYLFNQLRFGKVNKPTANTSIIQHAGRVFVVAEADLPYEIDPSNLKTLRVWDWDGKWDRPFTSHPKIDHNTGEMIIFGFSPRKPYNVVGVVSADGESIIHKCDIGLDTCTLSHDIAITKRYNVILDWPLVVDINRLTKGGNLIKFDGETVPARVGIMPRFGDAKTIRWFNVESNFTFHVINSYEEGDEVVLQGCRAHVSFIHSEPGMDKANWFKRALTPTKLDEASDPLIDGALIARAHEWRFNLKSGAVIERDLTSDSLSMEMPRINDAFVGCKHQYAYTSIVDLDASKIAGMPKYGKLAKLYLDERIEGDYIKMEFYDPGENKYLSEPLYVPRPNSQREDDGWIVTYVHDESCDVSEVHIIPAKHFCGKPIARIQLPQRVPYGFHSTFVQGIQ